MNFLNCVQNAQEQLHFLISLIFNQQILTMSNSANTYTKNQSSPAPNWRGRLFTDDYNELVNTFNILDQDGSGVINPLEISSVIRELGPDQSNPFILQLMEGLLQIQEPITLDVFIGWVVSQVGDLKTRDGIQKVFQRYDSDQNNFVSSTEFHEVAKQLHDCITEEQIDEMVHSVFINWETSSQMGLIFDQFYQVVTNFVTD